MNKNILLFVFAAIFSFIFINGLDSNNAFAQNSYNSRFLILTDDYNEHYLSPYLFKYETTNEDKPHDVVKLPAEPVIKNDTPYKIIKLSTSADGIWLGFDVQNKSSATNWALNFGTTFDGYVGLFDRVEIFTKNEDSNQITRSKSIGKHGLYPLTLNGTGKTKVLVKLQSQSGLPAMIPLKIVEYKNQATDNDYAVLSFMLFIFIGMVFFFAAISYVQSEKGYLFFSLYYLVIVIILSIQNSITPSSFHLIGQTITLLYFLLAFSACMMTKFFWNISNNKKIIDLAFNMIILFSFISVLNGLYGIQDYSFLKALFIYTPLFLIFVFISLISFFYSQKMESEKKSFLYGSLIFLFGFTISSLPFLGIIQPISTALNAFWFALLPQAFFLIIAVKQKLSLNKQNNISSQYTQINETDTVSRLRESRENKEQERLLKVIEQERKVLSELRKSEARRTEEMRKAKDIADQANKAKSAFLAVVTHEIRTPMTGIMGMVKLLMESNLSKEQKNYAQTIQESSDAMLALLNDILDFEKIEQGKMTFETITFDLHRVINGVATLMNGHAVQKNIELKTKLGDNVPQFVKGDPTRLRQVLLNLTGNAVKFTETGHVTITTERIDNDNLKDNYCEIYFSVIDSGIGISKEVQENLFAPFSQANNSIARKFGGTGLGLAISKGLVQAMGSEININSNEGEGSTFFFMLKMPLGNAPQNKETNNAAQDKNHKNEIAPKNILIVDDNQINLNVIHGLLAKLPHKVTTMNSAEKAIEITKEKAFDLILMDIELPGMSGDQASVKIRHDNDSLNKKTPIIAVTGNLLPDHIAQYKKCEMNDVLEKPIDPEKLITFVNRDYSNVEKEFQKIEVTTPLLLDEKEKDSVSVINSEVLDMLKSHLKKNDVQDMLNDVIIKSNEIVHAMNKHFEDKDFQKISDRCHELRGMTGNFGLTELSQFAEKIEMNIKNSVTDDLEKDLKTLEEKEKRASKALHSWLQNNFEE